MTPDSAAFNEDYAKRAVELGHKIISSVEHGFQGNYHQCFELAKKYDLKFIFGAEAYWVKNNREKDKTNGHIILLAKNENGRRQINKILSDANEFGYYYKPRVDVDSILSLPNDDVFITTACIGFWQYEDEYMNKFVARLKDRFDKNLMLEVQYHNTDKQKLLNEKILKLSKSLSIPIIVGMDSHYVYPEQAIEREYVLESKKMRYADEDGWYMDYPDDNTVIERFKQQGVLSSKQIKEAMDNTDILLDFDDYAEGDPVFSSVPKLPSLYDGKHSIKGKKLPSLNQEERNQLYSKLITRKLKHYLKGVPKEEHQMYYDGVKKEVNVYRNTGMVDYPLIDYEIVKRGIELGGVITNTGRGSGVSYFTNTLCGFSKVDRFKSPIKLYPERFMSEERILKTKSLPDLDLNLGTPEIFEQAQKEILGEDHAYPMIAFGTYKKKSAFKLYARAKGLDFDIANKISKQIEKYDTALKYASDDDERDEINIYDYVEEQYHDYIKQSQPYWGIISDKKKAPCAFLLYSGNIREEIGLIKCKSESSKKEYITTVIDGGIAEKYKFLKNDLLKVDTVSLTDMIYKRIGIEPHSVTELSNLVENDEKVWDIYAKGLTIGVNQCEKESTMEKVKKYKPQNISELSAFIAGIRPGFKSMYSKFASREPYEYGIKAFDDLIQTEQFPYSFIMYQEQLMTTLNYAGFPIDQCYQIIKDIAKKHPEKVRPLKSRFLDGFSKKIYDDCGSKEKAKELAERVWQIIDDSTSYSFNSSHAYCMALDSLYNAWQKANYPYEFYEVVLQTFSDKGEKDKVAEFKKEMINGFGIKEGDFKWGIDNRRFKADKEAHVIIPALVSIKGMSQKFANDLYKLSQSKSYNNFYSLWKDINNLSSSTSDKINKLIEINYFQEFGSIAKLKKFLEYKDIFYERVQFTISDEKTQQYKKIIEKFSLETTKKLYKKFDYDAALEFIWVHLMDQKISTAQVLRYELENLGYVKTIIPIIPTDYAMVTKIDGRYKNKNVTLHRISDGSQEIVKVKGKKLEAQPLNKGDIIKTIERKKDRKWRKDENGDFYQIDDKETILTKWNEVS